MEDRLSVLKNTFGGIVDVKESNITILKTLETRIHQIKQMYSDFIHANREQLFVFTLDSFHFQSKLIDLEFEDMNRMFLSITNRMYCDYFKLFKIMIGYIKENIQDKKLAELIKLHDNYPIYKDLEPFKQYDFQYIQSLHECILVILSYLHTFITNKEHDLKGYQTKNQIGLHIDSFVNTFSFNTFVMNQKALLFVTYIEFFHKSHTKYLKRFTMKLNLMLSQLNNDIKIETPVEKKEMIAGLREQNIDRGLLKELKVSIADDSSTTPRSKSVSTSLDEYDTGIQENVSDLSDEPITKYPSKFSAVSFNVIEPEPVIIETEPEPVIIETEPEPVIIETEPEPVIIETEPEPVTKELPANIEEETLLEPEPVTKEFPANIEEETLLEPSDDLFAEI
jgi:hypothetical protein